MSTEGNNLSSLAMVLLQVLERGNYIAKRFKSFCMLQCPLCKLK